MSRSRSSPVAGPSRSASPDAAPASSYRMERFDPSLTPSTDLMVTSRSKRSTAGNRLKALLDQELEKDEVFAEVENDVDFEANENEDGVDIVDSDFDRDSDDDARGAEDESEGEREIEAAEKVEKQKRRAAARAVGIVKRPAPPPRPTRRPLASTAAAEQETPAKRRRISFAPDQPSSSASPSAALVAGDSTRRTSARSSTVQSKLEVESRLEEASQRRAAFPAKPIVKKKASLTQDALIAEALEVEEENRESLRRFLEQEEERRAKQRQRKERITGPFVRWMSVGMKVKLVEEVDRDETKDKEKREEGDQSKHDVAEEKDGQKQHRSSVQQDDAPKDASGKVGNAEVVSVSEEKQNAQGGTNDNESVVVTNASVPSESILPKQSSDIDEAQPNGDSDDHKAESTAEEAKQIVSTAAAPEVQLNPSDATTAPTSAASPSAPSQATTTATPKSTTIPTSSSLTLDPAIAAREEAALLRTQSSRVAPSSSTSSSGYELQARTLLSVERMPEDWEWLDEYNALLGTHCAWDAYPYVPSRNRPLKPRQSMCPITGLPAIYRDPRTGIPYATATAYQVITRVLQNRYMWTGGHYQQRSQQDEKGKKKERAKGNGGGKVGTGAVPVEMGIYTDDETIAGPAGVWDKAREANKERLQSSAGSKSEGTPKRYSATPTAAPTTAASAATEGEGPAETPAEKERKKPKPRFEVVLTNAIAPGDEKAVLAAALELPAGSTRSGRRVHRP